MKRKTKRTAGERRYRKLARTAESVLWDLQAFRNNVVAAAAENKSYSAARITQVLTEAIERLKHEKPL